MKAFPTLSATQISRAQKFRLILQFLEFGNRELVLELEECSPSSLLRPQGISHLTHYQSDVRRREINSNIFALFANGRTRDVAELVLGWAGRLVELLRQEALFHA